MRIGELSTRTNVNTDTLRYYEKLGLIRSDRRENGYRDFDLGMVRLVGMVRMGQKLGFSLREMRNIVDAIANEVMSTDETTALLTGKISELDARIGEMLQMKKLLSEALEQVCPLRS